MKRPAVSFLVMIGVIAALFGLYILMAFVMEDSVNDMAEVFGEEPNGYDHYYDEYIQVKDVYIPKLDEGKLEAEDAGQLTRYVFEYYYRCYDTPVSAATIKDTDIKALDEIRDGYMLDILHSRMQFTDDDMEAARKDLMKNGLFNSSEALKYSDRYFERYR